MSELPKFRRVVEIKTIQAVEAAYAVAVLDDGSFMGGGMEGIEVRISPGRNGAAEFILSGLVKP